MVIVNTVVYVQAAFGLGERETALALAAFGGGSMLVALLLPGLLERVSDRSVILNGAALLVAGTFGAVCCPVLCSCCRCGACSERATRWRRHRRAGCCAARRIPRTDRRFSPRSSPSHTPAG